MATRLVRALGAAALVFAVGFGSFSAVRSNNLTYDGIRTNGVAAAGDRSASLDGGRLLISDADPDGRIRSI